MDVYVLPPLLAVEPVDEEGEVQYILLEFRNCL